MDKLLIEWNHYAKEGKTCERCSETGSNLLQAVDALKDELASKGVVVEIKETELPESRMADSNSLVINGVPLEKLIPQAQAGQNSCCSCSDMTGRPTQCRTVCQEGETYEEIPTGLIIAAILEAIEKR